MNPPPRRGGAGGSGGHRVNHVNHVNHVLNIPLVHLPLRPSSLKLLQQAGFVTSREVVQAKQQGGNGNSGGGGGGLAAFAAELSMTTTVSQAASIYREVVEASSSPSSSSSSSSSFSSRHDENNDSNNRPAQQQHHPYSHNKRPLVTSSSSSAAAAAAACSTSALSLLQNHGGGAAAANAAVSNSAVEASIVTFCRPVDQLLGGGIALQSVTEISGMPGTGKTQLAMQLAVDARLPLLVGGVAGECIYLDTEGSFSPERCYTMARALVHHVVAGQKKRQQQLLDANPSAPPSILPSLPLWFTPESILHGIHVFRVHDVAAQTAALLGAIPRLLQQRQAAGSPVRLIVIDIMAFHYRAAAATAASAASNSSNSSVGDFMDRTRQLARIASHLAELAMTFQVAVVALNQMTTKVVVGASTASAGEKSSSAMMDHRHEVVPALGEAWAHSVTTRLLLVNHDDNDSHEPNTTSSSMNNNNNKPVLRRSCHLIKSPRLAPGRAFFQVCESGIRGLEFQDRQRQHEVEQQQQQQQASKRQRA